MTPFAALALLITVTALLGWLNERVLHLPTVVGVTVGGVLLSLLLIVAAQFGIGGADWAESFLGQINFDRLVLSGMLSFLLFAGALGVDLEHLRKQRLPILLLATLGTIVSTIFVGGAMYIVLHALGWAIPFVWALAFGALISPTDPIAVLAIMRDSGAPRSVTTLISGESLFNDGVGVVLFAVIVDVIVAGGGHGSPHTMDVLSIFLREAAGGIAFGAAIGAVAYVFLKSLDNYTIEIMVTLAVVTGGYALAHWLHTSGPLAMVVAGIIVGTRGRAYAMSDHTREHLDTFWMVIDESLNAILFVLIGLEVLIVRNAPALLLPGAIAIVIVLAARFSVVAPPLAFMRARYRYPRYTVRLMTWGGLRGAIAIALALALPDSEWRPLIIVMTYTVVLFSIVAQGLTVGPLARRLTGDRPAEADG